MDRAILRKGSKGDDVRLLQRCLHLEEDGIFGSVTEEAVKDYQKRVGLAADGVVGKGTWAELLEDNGLTVKEVGNASALGLAKIKKANRRVHSIILHCTATREGQNVTVADVTKWHKAQGWNTIGYHYLVYLDGSVHVGRDIEKVGAHCNGHNTGTIGICYVGGLAKDGKTAKDTRTWEQTRALRLLVRELMDEYGLRASDVYGHYMFSSKACPSFDVKEFRKLL